MRYKLFITVVLTALLSIEASAGTDVKDSLGVDKSVAQTPAALLKGKVSGVRVSLTDGSPNGVINTDRKSVV